MDHPTENRVRHLNKHPTERTPQRSLCKWEDAQLCYSSDKRKFILHVVASTPHPSKWLKIKSLTVPSAGEGGEPRKCSLMAGGRRGLCDQYLGKLLISNDYRQARLEPVTQTFPGSSSACACIYRQQSMCQDEKGSSTTGRQERQTAPKRKQEHSSGVATPRTTLGNEKEWGAVLCPAQINFTILLLSEKCSSYHMQK